jgi:Glucanosyltransferase
MRSLINLVSLGLLASSSLVCGLNPIGVQGNGFFDTVTMERFYIRGVDYQVHFGKVERVTDFCSLVAVLL